MSYAAVVRRPIVSFPRHVMTRSEMHQLAEHHYGSSPDIHRIQEMIENTQIERRHFAVPPQSLREGTGLAERAALYMEHARPLARRVATEALEAEDLDPQDLDAIIMVSCTSFVMPSLDAYLINDLGFRPTIKRMPLAQLGCSAGASALLRAQDHCRAYPRARVLIVCVELSSLCFFSEYKDLTSAVCASIFGDGAAACIVTGREAGSSQGLQLRTGLTYTEPHSEHYIRYAITERGYHLTLDKQVMRAVPRVIPFIQEMLAQDCGIKTDELDFVLAHTGGKRIIDALGRSLKLDDAKLENSRASLREFGNTSSVSILDVIRRSYENERPHHAGRQNHGLLVAFGPGFTMDALSARWN